MGFGRVFDLVFSAAGLDRGAWASGESHVSMWHRYGKPKRGARILIIGSEQRRRRNFPSGWWFGGRGKEFK